MRFLERALKKSFGMSFLLVLLLLLAGCEEKPSTKGYLLKEINPTDLSYKGEKEFSEARKEGEILLKGKTKEEKEKGLKILENIAEEGDVWAQVSLYHGYLDSWYEIPKNEERGEKWLQQALKDSTPQLAHLFGLMAMYGDTVFKGPPEGMSINDKRAAIWFQNAIKKGHIEANCSFSELSIFRLGKTRSSLESFMAKGLAKKEPRCYHLEGYLYSEGLAGVPKNDKKAFLFAKKSAEVGNPQGQFALGRLYQEGQGAKKNQELGIYWIKKAAEQGLAEAKNFLTEQK